MLYQYKYYIRPTIAIVGSLQSNTLTVQVALLDANLNESDVELPDLTSEQVRYLAEEDRHVVRSSLVDSRSTVGTDEQRVTAEDT